MSWQKLIAYALGGIGLIVLGWLLNSVPKPSIEVKERVIYDTVFQTKKITFTEVKSDTISRITDRKFVYADSIVGTKDDVDYQIKHTVQNDSQVLSLWKVNLEPKLKTITQYITKDSIRTIVDTKFIPQPFFLQTWFYISIVELAVIVLAIIF